MIEKSLEVRRKEVNDNIPIATLGTGLFAEEDKNLLKKYIEGEKSLNEIIDEAKERYQGGN